MVPGNAVSPDDLTVSDQIVARAEDIQHRSVGIGMNRNGDIADIIFLTAAGFAQGFVLQLFKLCHGDCLLHMFFRVLCG